MEEVVEYIRNRVEPGDIFNGTPCLLWQLRIHKRGYGVAKIGGKSIYAHRLSYELNKGKIPDGYTVDHLCSVHSCVNPKHLEAVTMEENNRRYMVKYRDENPYFPCGHLRSKTAVYSKGGRFRSGAIKMQVRCSICITKYNREYMRQYTKTHKSSSGADIEV